MRSAHRTLAVGALSVALVGLSVPTAAFAVSSSIRPATSAPSAPAEPAIVSSIIDPPEDGGVGNPTPSPTSSAPSPTSTPTPTETSAPPSSPSQAPTEEPEEEEQPEQTSDPLPAPEPIDEEPVAVVQTPVTGIPIVTSEPTDEPTETAGAAPLTDATQTSDGTSIAVGVLIVATALLVGLLVYMKFFQRKVAAAISRRNEKRPVYRGRGAPRGASGTQAAARAKASKVEAAPTRRGRRAAR